MTASGTAEARVAGDALTFERSGRRILTDITFHVKAGRITGLLGTNGAGKSTLLRLLTGYLKPDSGGCLLAGKALDEWHPETLSRYRAVMRQHTQPGFDWLVEEIVGMGRAPWSPQPEPSIVRKVMQLTGCLPLAGRRYHSLSGGEQQRVQLARALAQLWREGTPRGWLFLDEPTSALDIAHQVDVLAVGPDPAVTQRQDCFSGHTGDGIAGRRAGALVRCAGARRQTSGARRAAGFSRPLA